MSARLCVQARPSAQPPDRAFTDNKYTTTGKNCRQNQSGEIKAFGLDMNPKNVYGVNIVLIRRGSKSFVPGGNDSLLPDDTVYVVGTSKEISAFREAINGNKQKKK